MERKSLFTRGPMRYDVCVMTRRAQAPLRRRGRAACVALLAAGLVSCRDRAPAEPTAPPAKVEPMSSGQTASAAVRPSATASATPRWVIPDRVWFEGGAMGTHVSFAGYTTETVDKAGVRAAFEAALAEIKRVELLMTTWRDDSDVSRINAAAGKAPVKVSEETFAVIKQSIHAGDISEGTFDITFEALHGLWKFDEDLDPHPPSAKDIKARLPLLDYKAIKIDESARTVMITKPGMKIGLGGIAKGYAVDMAAKVLEKAGLKSYFVQAGGDLLARGNKPDGSPWSAGIRDPRGGPSQYFAKILLQDHAFSTAGDYERGYVVGGKRYHHIIDPRTGYPATACRSVTIWAPTAFLADEIDDAVFILGPEKGLALVESIDGVGAVIVDAKNKIHVSKRLQGLVQIVALPTDGI